MNKLKLEAPWYTYNKKVKALFDGDPDISVGDVIEAEENGETNYMFDMEIRNHEKFIALDRVMPKKVTFGNVTMAIVLYDEENLAAAEDAVALYETIFAGNPIVDSVQLAFDHTGTKHGFVLFKPEVVQFYDDNTYDYNRLWSGLAQDIAREVFQDEVRGIHFCTAEVGHADE